MKRALTMVLALVLALGMCPAALAQGEPAVLPKLTPLNERITAYVTYLGDVFDDSEIGSITHVGLADVNRDRYPELFYVQKEDGESYAHFCYYEEGEVLEYETDENYLGIAPKSISLVRRRRVNSSEHCWVLEAQFKDEEKWNHRIAYVFQRSEASLVGEIKYLKLWKSGGYRYFVDGAQTIKLVYTRDMKQFYARWPEANMDVNVKSRGVVRKVAAPKKWLSLRRTMGYAVNAWNAM